MKHWRLEQVSWDRFDPSAVDPDVLPLVKAAAMVERNGNDYALYLKGVFRDDPDFCQAAENWAVEEVQHGEALARWALLVDPEWDFPTAFQRYRTGFAIDTRADASVRGSRTGELIARCVVETGTSSYYTALAEATREPVLREICRLIAADEYRHFKLFYDHMRRYLARENLNFVQRLRIAAGRMRESESDELAFAYHCSSEPLGTTYGRDRCLTGYMGRAMAFYRPHHVERITGMVFKAIGLEPRGRIADLACRGGWRLLAWRRERYREALRRQTASSPPPAMAEAA